MLPALPPVLPEAPVFPVVPVLPVLPVLPLVPVLPVLPVVRVRRRGPVVGRAAGPGGGAGALAVPVLAVLAISVGSLEVPVWTDPFDVVSDRNEPASGWWMLRMTAPVSLPAPDERNPTPEGEGITMPAFAASRVIRWSSISEPTLARSASLRACSVELSWIERPMLAPSFSTSTCIATIPASIRPSMGIHTRPRMMRSSSGWSGRAGRTRAPGPRARRPSAAASPGALCAAARMPAPTRRRFGRGSVSGTPGSAIVPALVAAAAARRPPTGPETRRGRLDAAARFDLPKPGARWGLGVALRVRGGEAVVAALAVRAAAGPAGPTGRAGPIGPAGPSSGRSASGSRCAPPASGRPA